MLYERDELSWDLTRGPEVPPADARLAMMIAGGNELVSGSSSHWEAPRLGEVPNSESIEFLSLGTINGQLWYACEAKEQALPGSRWARIGLREVLGQSEQAFAVASRASQLVQWRRQHRYCGQCGQPTEAGRGEHYRWCAPCKLRFYPRINPCIIVLVVDGDRVLLAQGNRHRQRGWYSTLAGFMEPGESAEQAVVREVYEEVGVDLGRLRYMNSQTWPFPHQLMLGFIADYAGGEIRRQESEIAHAQWWDLNNLPQHPPAHSISGWLIHQYKQERGLAGEVRDRDSASDQGTP